MKTFWVLFPLLALAGCSTWHHVEPGDGPKRVASPRFAHDVPQGWTYSMVGDDVVVSRDAPGIQHVATLFNEWGEPIDGDPEDEKLVETVLPTDVASQVIEARRRELGVENIDTTMVEPAAVANLDGFRSEYSYRTVGGVTFRGLCYGAMDPDGVFVLRYEAPAIHFYERDLKTFERIVASARAASAAERRELEEKRKERALF